MNLPARITLDSLSMLNRRQLLKLTGTSGLLHWTWPDSNAAGNPYCGTSSTELSSRAIVIGINQYQDNTRAPDLVSPVKDACGFVSWLVTVARVDPAAIILLTNPHPDELRNPDIDRLKPGETIDAESWGEISWKRASALEIFRTIKDVFSVPGSDGGRLYFYYSGHGGRTNNLLRAGSRTSLSDDDTLLPYDFSDVVSAFRLNWILGCFAGSNFYEQFYFLDACRSTIAPKADPSSFPINPTVPMFTPSQHILFSTFPGDVAKDTGAFGSKLIEILSRGDANSVELSESGDKYRLRWERLRAWLVSWFDKNPVSLGRDEMGVEHFLRPGGLVYPGQYCETSPCVVEWFESGVSTATLSLLCTSLPPGTVAVVEIYNQERTTRVDRQFLRTSGTVNSQLIKGDYVIDIFVDERRIPEIPVELTQNKAINVNLGAAQEVALAPDPPMIGGLAPRNYVAADGGGGKLRVYSNPMTPIEILDERGNSLKLTHGAKPPALGHMGVSGLTSGFFQVRAYSADSFNERIVPVAEIDNGALYIEAPNQRPPLPAAKRIRTVLNEEANRYEDFSEAGALLAQATRKIDARRPGADRLMSLLGLRTFPENNSGIRLFLAADVDLLEPSGGALEGWSFAIGSLEGSEFKELTPHQTEIPGIASDIVPREPGPFRLRIERRLGDRTDSLMLTSTLIPGRISELIFECESSGELHITQFSLQPRPARLFPSSLTLQIYQCERDFQDGNIRRVAALLPSIGQWGPVDPFCLTIAAYTSHVTGNSNGLQEAASALIENFPGIPDGYVARAVALERDQRLGEAAAALRRSLDISLPTLAPFTRLLFDGVRRLRVDHPRMRMLQNAVYDQASGFPWTLSRLPDPPPNA